MANPNDSYALLSKYLKDNEELIANATENALDSYNSAVSQLAVKVPPRDNRIQQAKSTFGGKAVGESYDAPRASRTIGEGAADVGLSVADGVLSIFNSLTATAGLAATGYKNMAEALYGKPLSSPDDMIKMMKDVTAQDAIREKIHNSKSPKTKQKLAEFDRIYNQKDKSDLEIAGELAKFYGRNPFMFATDGVLNTGVTSVGEIMLGGAALKGVKAAAGLGAATKVGISAGATSFGHALDTVAADETRELDPRNILGAAGQAAFIGTTSGLFSKYFAASDIDRRILTGQMAARNAESKGFDKLLPPSVRATVHEGTEELIQSGGETVIDNIAAERDPTHRALLNALHGSMVGAGVGGTLHGVTSGLPSSMSSAVNKTNEFLDARAVKKHGSLEENMNPESEKFNPLRAQTALLEQVNSDDVVVAKNALEQLNALTATVQSVKQDFKTKIDQTNDPLEKAKLEKELTKFNNKVADPITARNLANDNAVIANYDVISSAVSKRINKNKDRAGEFQAKLAESGHWANGLLQEIREKGLVTITEEPENQSSATGNQEYTIKDGSTLNTNDRTKLDNAIKSLDQRTNFRAIAAKYGVPTDILIGVIATESGGRYDTKNSSGNAVGLLQHTSIFRKNYNITLEDSKNVTDAAIEATVKDLADNYKYFGNKWEHAVLAYNAGRSGAKAIIEGRQAPNTEQKNYVPTVVKYVTNLQQVNNPQTQSQQASQAQSNSPDGERYGELTSYKIVPKQNNKTPVSTLEQGHNLLIKDTKFLEAAKSMQFPYRVVAGLAVGNIKNGKLTDLNIPSDVAKILGIKNRNSMSKEDTDLFLGYINSVMVSTGKRVSGIVAGVLGDAAYKKWESGERNFTQAEKDKLNTVIDFINAYDNDLDDVSNNSNNNNQSAASTENTAKSFSHQLQAGSTLAYTTPTGQSVNIIGLGDDKIKPGDVVSAAGLKINGSLKKVGNKPIHGFTMEFAQLTQNFLGDRFHVFTSFNDNYKAHATGHHPAGRAFDFVIHGSSVADKKAKAKVVKAELEQLAKEAGYKIVIADEYNNPSKGASGLHMHVTVKGRIDGTGISASNVTNATSKGELTPESQKAVNAANTYLNNNLFESESIEENQERIDSYAESEVEKLFKQNSKEDIEKNIESLPEEYKEELLALKAEFDLLAQEKDNLARVELTNSEGKSNIFASSNLTTNQVNALRELEAVKLAMANLRGADGVTKDILKGHRGADNSSSHMGISDYENEFKNAIRSDDTKTFDYYMGMLNRFVESHQSKDALIQANLANASNQNPITIAPFDNKWEIINPNDYTGDAFHKAAPFQIWGENKATEAISKEADLITSLRDAWLNIGQQSLTVAPNPNAMAVTKSANTARPNNAQSTGNQQNNNTAATPTNTGSTTSQQQQQATTAPTPPQQQSAQQATPTPTQSRNIPLTRVGGLNSTPQGGVFLGRNPTNNASMSQVKPDSNDSTQAVGVGEQGWLAMPYNKGDNASKLEQYIGKFKENSSKFDNFVQGVIDLKGKDLYAHKLASNKSEAPFISELVQILPDDVNAAKELISRIEGYTAEDGIKLARKPQPISDTSTITDATFGLDTKSKTGLSNVTDETLEANKAKIDKAIANLDEDTPLPSEGIGLNLPTDAKQTQEYLDSQLKEKLGYDNKALRQASEENNKTENRSKIITKGKRIKGKASAPITSKFGRRQKNTKSAVGKNIYSNQYLSMDDNGEGILISVVRNNADDTITKVSAEYVEYNGTKTPFGVPAKEFESARDQDVFEYLKETINWEGEFDQIDISDLSRVPDTKFDELTLNGLTIRIPKELSDFNKLEDIIDTLIPLIEDGVVGTKERKFYIELIKPLLNYNPDLAVTFALNEKGESTYDEKANLLTIRQPAQGASVVQELTRMVVGLSTSKVAAAITQGYATHFDAENKDLIALAKELQTVNILLERVAYDPENSFREITEYEKSLIVQALDSLSNLIEMSTTHTDFMKLIKEIKLNEKQAKGSLFNKIVNSVKSFFTIASRGKTSDLFDRMLEITARAVELQGREVEVSFEKSEQGKIHVFQDLIAAEVNEEIAKPFGYRNELKAKFKQVADINKPLSAISNLSSKLKLDLLQGLSKLKAQVPNKTQREQLIDFLKFRDELATHLVDTFKRADTSTKDGRDFAYSDYKSYLMDENGVIDENVLTAVAVAVYDWIIANGGKEQHTDQSLKKLLGLDPYDTTYIDPVIRETYKHRMVLKSRMGNALGKNIVKALGIEANDNATITSETFLDNSLGEWAIAAMQSANLIYFEDMPYQLHFQTMKDLGAEVSEDALANSQNATATFVKVVDGENGEIRNTRLNEIASKNTGTYGYFGELFGYESTKRYPVLERPKGVKESIKKTVSKLALSQIKLMEKMQDEEMQLDDTSFDSLLAMLNNFPEIATVMLGAHVTEESLAKLHFSERDSSVAAAQGIQDEIDNLLDFAGALPKDDKGNTVGFFDSVYGARNNRMHYNSNVVNFQTSLVHRAVVGYKNFETNIELGEDFNPESPTFFDENGKVNSLGLFIKAIGEYAEGAENHIKEYLKDQPFTQGFTADKLPITAFGDAMFNYLTTDATVQAGVDAAIKLMDSPKSMSKADAAAIAAVVDAWEGKTESFRALLEWARFSQAIANGDTTFNTTLGISSDGINNGSALGYLLLGVANKEFLEQVGIFLESSDYDNYQATRTNPNIGDYYTAYASYLEKAINDADQTDNLLAIKALNSSLEGRKFLKALLIPFGYSAGVKRLQNIAFDQFMTDIKDQLVKFSKLDLDNLSETETKQIEAFNTAMQSLLEDKDYQVVLGKDALEHWYSPQQVNKLRKVYKKEMGKIITNSMDAYTGLFSAARKINVAIHAATANLYIRQKEQLDKAAEEMYFNTLRQDERYSDLDDAAIKRIIEQEGMPKAFYKEHVQDELDRIKPTVNTPNNYESYGVDQGFQLIEGKTTLRGNPSLRTNTYYVNENEDLVLTSNRLNQSVMVYEGGGVVTNSAQIQGMDARIASEFSAKSDQVVIDIHDAGRTGINNFESMVTTQNKATFVGITEYSMMGESVITLMTSLDKHLNKLMDGEISIKQFEEDLTAVASDMFSEYFQEYIGLEFDFSQLSDVIKALQFVVDTAIDHEYIKLDTVSNIKSWHQYGGEGSPYIVDPKVRESKVAEARKNTDYFVVSPARTIFNRLINYKGEYTEALKSNQKLIDRMSVKLPGNDSKAHQKDQAKSNKSTKFIGFGKKGGTTDSYRNAWGNRANAGNYSQEDNIFINADNGKDRVSLKTDKAFADQVKLAANAGATFITDNKADRELKFNESQREIAEVLEILGYKETEDGVWTIEVTSKSQNTPVDTSPLDPSEYINHSGGAYGADTLWDLVGREYGVVNHQHYRDGNNTSLSKRLRNKGVKAVVLTKEMMDKARQQIKELLGITYADDIRGNLQVRNFYQVNNADSVFAIAPLKGNNAVTGGTNTAVQLAIKLGKPVHVWDTTSEAWYTYDNGSFVQKGTPKLTKNFAGVGTRDIENYQTKNKQTGKWENRKEYLGEDKTNKAIQAIKDVYENSIQKTLNTQKYEVSTAGDKRFSALVAKLSDGRTIEEAYQLDVKGFRESPTDKNWKKGKGKKPKNAITEQESQKAYKELWRTYLDENPDLKAELVDIVINQGKILTDSKAAKNAVVNQATALTDLAHEFNNIATTINNDLDPNTAISVDYKTVAELMAGVANGTLDYRTLQPIAYSRSNKPVQVTPQQMAEAEKKAWAVHTKMFLSRAWGTGALQQVYKLGDELLPENLVKPLLIAVEKNNPNVAVTVVRDLFATQDKAVYIADKNLIVLHFQNIANDADLSQVLLHEYIHALTVQGMALNKDTDAYIGLEAMRQELLEARNREIVMLEGGNPNQKDFLRDTVLESVEEMVAYGLSDKKHMLWIAQNLNGNYSKLNNAKKLTSGFGKFISYIKGIFKGLGLTNKQLQNFDLFSRYAHEMIQKYDASVKQRAVFASSLNQAKRQATIDALANLSHGNATQGFNQHLDSLNNKILHGYFGSSLETQKAVHNVLNNPSVKAITAGFTMSDKELMTMELMQTVMQSYFETQSGTKAVHEMRKLFKDTMKVLNEDSFLADPANATRAERAIARRKLNYFTDGRGNNAKEHAVRFISMALANEEFYNLVKNMDVPKTSRNINTVFDKFMVLFEKFSGWFTAQTLNLGHNVPTDLENLMVRVADIDYRARTQNTNTAEIMYQKGIGAVAAPLNFVTNKLTGIIFGSLNLRLGNGAIGTAASAIRKFHDLGLNESTEHIIEYMAKNSRTGSNRLGEFGEMLNEMSIMSGVRTTMEGLLRATNKAGQDRQGIKTGTTKVLLEQFSDNGKNVAPGAFDSVTRVVLRSGIVELIDNGYNLNKVIGFLKDVTKRQAEIQALENAIAQAHSDATYLINQSKDLGYQLATEKSTTLNLKNAESIVARLGTVNRNPDLIHTETTLLNQINALSSLYAIEYSKPSDIRAVRNLFDTENKGMKAIIGQHRAMTIVSKADFASNPFSYNKGYVPNESHHLRSITFTSDPQEGALLESEGWIKMSDGGVLTQDVNDTTNAWTMYFHRDYHYSDYVSGALDMKDTHRKGFTVFDSINNRADINATNAAKAQEIADRDARFNGGNYDPRRAYNGKTFLVPSYNDTGHVIAYSYEMEAETRDKLLERNNNAVELLGTLTAGITFKPQIQEVQKEIAKEMYEDYKKWYRVRSNAFVIIDPTSTDPEVQKMWKMMPSAFREEAVNQFGLGNPIVIRSNVYNMVFGFKSYSLSEMFDKSPEQRKWFEKLLVSITEVVFGDTAKMRTLQAERFIQAGVTNIKDMVVIRNIKVLWSNLVSNSLMLMMMGISPMQQYKDFNEVWRNGKLYREQANRLIEINAEMNIHRNNNTKMKELRRQKNVIETEMEQNPLHSLMEAGLMSTIVEDVNVQTQATKYKSDGEVFVENLTKPVPEAIKKGFAWVTMGKGTPLHDFMSHSTQFSDLAAKYSLIKHRMKEGDSQKVAIGKAQDTFINYDIPTTKSLDYMNRMGLFMFTKFFLRFQYIIQNIMNKRAGSLVAQHMLTEHFAEGYGILDPYMVNRIGNIPLEGSLLNYPKAFMDISTISAAKAIAF